MPATLICDFCSTPNPSRSYLPGDAAYLAVPNAHSDGGTADVQVRKPKKVN